MVENRVARPASRPRPITKRRGHVRKPCRRPLRHRTHRVAQRPGRLPGHHRLHRGDAGGSPHVRDRRATRPRLQQPRRTGRNGTLRKGACPAGYRARERPAEPLLAFSPRVRALLSRPRHRISPALGESTEIPAGGFGYGNVYRKFAAMPCGRAFLSTFFRTCGRRLGSVRRRRSRTASTLRLGSRRATAGGGEGATHLRSADSRPS